ncbi:Zinc phosphodiesterase ELAC protein 1 [Gracilariopsis chorda]|uniref:Zinc phosphodiesterase ELAC protein 1 n=1 Tax=Gracilariopsis chorda TaxID=448386 RepID=A0A2V3J304_9FLOR|nr:Zinc phosphodiesterase ELAC protein 1 [Gracilariopsis chorda]|eukprot:PXF48788.1 Zinc phosphodiesterase ELAC protein 1 [Gracilariopsis chorda]
MRAGLVRNIFVTHLHGDHLYGLPGMVMSILGRRDILSGLGEKPLNVYGPQGIRSFLRMALGVASFRMPTKSALKINELIWPKEFGPQSLRNRHRSASTYWNHSIKRLPFELPGRDINAVKDSEGRFTYQVTQDDAVVEKAPKSKRKMRRDGVGTVVAAPVLHTVPTLAYCITENKSSQRFDKEKLLQLGIPTDGREEVRALFQKWTAGEKGMWDGKEILVEEVVQEGRQPRRMCVVGDTYDADGATHIAKDVDVLVHEATLMAASTHTARSRGHSSTIGATKFAKKVGARRLILNHASVSYSERKMRAMEMEARAMLGGNKAYVARDLSIFSVPTKVEDNEDFTFRRFVGFADTREFKDPSGNPFSGDFEVGEEDDAEGISEDEFDVLKADDVSEETEDEETPMLVDIEDQPVLRDEIERQNAIFTEQIRQNVMTA